MNNTTIESVQVWRFTGRMPVERPVNGGPGLGGVYGDWRPRGVSLAGPVQQGNLPVRMRYLVLRTRGGHQGLFQGTPGFMDQHLDTIAPAFLLGKDALDAAHIWQDIHRAPRHGTRGDVHVSLSMVDIALWDLRGKIFGVPAATLMGGTRRRQLPAYGMVLSVPGERSDDLAVVRDLAAWLKEKGYRYQKWILPDGDPDSLQLLKRRVEKTRVLREALGDDADFILCCGLGREAKALFRAVEPYAPMHIQTGVEKGLQTLFAEIRQMSSVPVGAGQGIESRWDLAGYLNPRCVDCLGYDPEKGGGLTELLRMSYMAEAFGLTVYPHAALPANLHLAAALPQKLCPMVESLIAWNPHKLFFEAHDFEPKQGVITLPDYPGIFRLAEERIESREKIKEWTLK